MIFGRLKIYFVAAGAFVVAVVSAYFRGRKEQAASQENERLVQYVETRQKMDEVGSDGGPDRARAVLRARQQPNGDLRRNSRDQVRSR